VTDDAGWRDLGVAIRERRRAAGLTLVALAEKATLSQPFLSQVENGRARPSMASLYRIASALDTTPQALFGARGSMDEPTLVRGGAARAVDVSGTDASMCHLLVAGDVPFHVLEFVGLPSEFLERWEHPGFEAAYVIAGQVEIDVAGEIRALGAGDLLSYPASSPHRLRGRSADARVLLIASHP
jgi:transcriptional regulator with XRE-family HTH domain